MADKKPSVRWSDDALTEAGEQTVWMSPDDYLKLSPKMEKAPWSSKKGKELQESIADGDDVNEVPSLTVKKGVVTAQDGRHRALAAKDAGIRMIPVRLAGDQIAEGREITGMQGAKVKLQGRPRAWEDVVKDPEFRRLPAEERQAARRDYFNEVIAPRLSAADVEEARSQFEEDTRPRRAPRDVPDEPLPDPTEGMSTGKLYTAGVGRLGPQLKQAGGTLARDVLEGALGGGEGQTPARFGSLEAPPLGRKIADVLGLQTPQDVEETRGRDAPLLATSGGMAGDITRNALLAAPLALAPGANTLIGSALYGGGYGLTVPAGSWSERGTNIVGTAATSGAVTGGVRAVPALWRAFVSPLTSKGREGMALNTIQRFASDPDAVRNALSRPAPPGAPAIDELVPGSRATLAEVTGDPGIAQAQRAAQAASPDAANVVADLRTSRLAARKKALLDRFGIGNKEALEETRDRIAERLYRKAWQEPITPKQIRENRTEIHELLSRPSVERARSSAVNIAREEGEVLSRKDLRGTGSVKGMHYMKKALDSEISVAKRSGDDNQVRLLMGTRKKMMDVIEKLSPAYKKANEEYAKASKPINQAEVGAYLYDKLIPALSDVGAERITSQRFAQVLKDGNRMAAKATGFSGAKLKDILTTDQWNTVINLAKDVGRESGAVERAHVPGSPTAQYLSGRNVLKQILGPVGLPETWSEKMTADLLANRWTSLAARPIERDIQNRLAVMLADPRAAVAAQAAKDAGTKRSLPRAANALTRYGLGPASGAAGLTVTGSQ